MFHDPAFTLLPVTALHDSFSNSIVSRYDLKNTEMGTSGGGSQAEALLFLFSPPSYSSPTAVARWGQPCEIRGDESVRMLSSSDISYIQIH